MLFNLLDSRDIPIDLPVITGNMYILYFDELPMLYTGSNANGDIIVGSVMCEDEDGEIIRYMHILPRAKDYSNFIRRKISYRDLIRSQSNVFLIDKDEKDNTIGTYYFPVKNIPEEYLPHPKLLCPNPEVVTGVEFTISLKGRMADIHEALVEPVRNLSKSANQIFKSIIDGVRSSTLIPEVHQTAFSPTSFGINFKMKFTSSDVFFNEKSEAALNEFVSIALTYSLNQLSAEAEQVATGDIEGTVYQTTVLSSLERAYDLLHIKVDDKIKARLITGIKKIPSELEKMTEELGNGFDYLEIKSKGHSSEQPVGIIDNEFKSQIEAAAMLIESRGSIVVEDEDFKVYKIHVYHLNIETRRGNAHIGNKNDKGVEIQDNPKISFKGEGELTGSSFINSMDTGEWIEVNAKAKKVNGRFKSLQILFE